MTNEEQLKILKQGVEVWNRWRQDNPEITPDLSELDLAHEDFILLELSNGTFGSNSGLIIINMSQANFRNVDFSGASLSNVDFQESDFSGATLTRVNMIYSNLSKANLSKSNLSFSLLDDADFSYSDLSETKIAKIP
ncbi:MAG: pentapeptide repeat-containing protein [Cyanobacteria bacterium P01_G01_bin.39]